MDKLIYSKTRKKLIHRINALSSYFQVDKLMYSKKRKKLIQDHQCIVNLLHNILLRPVSIAVVRPLRKSRARTSHRNGLPFLGYSVLERGEAQTGLLTGPCTDWMPRFPPASLSAPRSQPPLSAIPHLWPAQKICASRAEGGVFFAHLHCKVMPLLSSLL